MSSKYCFETNIPQIQPHTIHSKPSLRLALRVDLTMWYAAHVAGKFIALRTRISEAPRRCSTGKKTCHRIWRSPGGQPIHNSAYRAALCKCWWSFWTSCHLEWTVASWTQRGASTVGKMHKNVTWRYMKHLECYLLYFLNRICRTKEKWTSSEMKLLVFFFHKNEVACW